MKRDLTLTLDSVEYSVIVDGNAITVNDRGFAVEVVNDSTVLVDGIVYHVTLGESQATVDGQTFALQLDEGATGTATSPSAPRNVPAAVQESRPGAIPAVMPGKVLRLLVEPGQYVEEGDPICILEAMKMENELHASRSGIVRAVHVQSGDDVEKGQVLLEIEQTE